MNNNGGTPPRIARNVGRRNREEVERTPVQGGKPILKPVSPPKGQEIRRDIPEPGRQMRRLNLDLDDEDDNLQFSRRKRKSRKRKSNKSKKSRKRKSRKRKSNKSRKRK